MTCVPTYRPWRRVTSTTERCCVTLHAIREISRKVVSEGGFEHMFVASRQRMRVHATHHNCTTRSSASRFASRSNVEIPCTPASLMPQRNVQHSREQSPASPSSCHGSAWVSGSSSSESVSQSCSSPTSAHTQIGQPCGRTDQPRQLRCPALGRGDQVRPDESGGCGR